MQVNRVYFCHVIHTNIFIVIEMIKSPCDIPFGYEKNYKNFGVTTTEHIAYLKYKQFMNMLRVESRQL